MNDGHRLDQLDLLAYADGLLDGDPARKAQVKEVLRASPEEASRVRAYQEQTEALRQRYGPRIADPVPDRLYAALERRPNHRYRYMARAAAVAVLTVTAGASGWLAGQWDRSESSHAEAFIEQSYLSYAKKTSNPSAEPVTHPAPVRPMNWLSNEVSLTIRAPDLRDRGFSILEKQTVDVGDSQMVRLTYGASDGRSFSLFLRPRWEDQGPGVQVTTQGDISLAYWLDGPLASAIASRLPPEETLALAETVRRAMRDPQQSAPVVLAPRLDPSRQGAAITTGALSDDVPMYPERSPLPPGIGRGQGDIVTTN